MRRKKRLLAFFFSSRRRHTRWTGDWSSDVCSSDLELPLSWGAPFVLTAIAWEVAKSALMMRSEERRVGKECIARRFDAGLENQKELTKMQLYNQKEIAEMQDETQ